MEVRGVSIMPILWPQDVRRWRIRRVILFAGVLGFVTVLAIMYIYADPLRDPTNCKPTPYAGLFKGGHLWWWQAISLERHLSVYPADLCARALLRGYYERRMYFPGPWPTTHGAVERRLLDHYLWFVSNVPHERIAQNVPFELRQDGKEIDAAWRAQADQSPDDTVLLLTAGRLLNGSDPRLSLRYLEHAASLDPDNEDVAYWLGVLFETHAAELGLDKDTALQKAFAYYAAATAHPRSTHLESVAESAISAGNLSMADSLAERIVAYGDKGGFGSRDDAIHHGHLLLGRVALRRRDIESAKHHLLAAAAVTGSPGLDSFGPNMLLAKELLEIGEREVVLDYFARISQFWKGGCDGSLDDWAAVIRRGEVPQFGANLSY